MKLSLSFWPIVGLIAVAVPVLSWSNLFNTPESSKPEFACDIVKLGEKVYCFEDSDGIKFRTKSRNNHKYGGFFKGSNKLTYTSLFFSSKHAKHARYPEEVGFFVEWKLPDELSMGNDNWLVANGTRQSMPWTIRVPHAGSTYPEFVTYKRVVFYNHRFGHETKDISTARWRDIERTIQEASDSIGAPVDISDKIYPVFSITKAKVVIKKKHIVHLIEIKEPNDSYRHLVNIKSQYPDDSFQYSINYVGNEGTLEEMLKKWLRVSEEFRRTVLKAEQRASVLGIEGD